MAKRRIERPRLVDKAVDRVMIMVLDDFQKELSREGEDVAFVSSHEVLGRVTLEMDRLRRSMKEGYAVPGFQTALRGMAVAVLLGLACYNEELLSH